MKQFPNLIRLSALTMAVILMVGLAAGCSKTNSPAEPSGTETVSATASGETTALPTDAAEPGTEPMETIDSATEPSAGPDDASVPGTAPAKETVSQPAETSKPTETSKPAATEHTHSYNSKVTAPTCTEKGYTTYTCTICGYSYTGNETAATGHSYQDMVIAPTCTAEGYTLHKCTVCGYSYSDNATAAKGHTWGQWTTTAQPTATSEGTEERTCSVCGARESRQVARLVTSTSAFELEVCRLVNAEREKEGLAPLEYDTTYQPAAAIRAKEIQELFEHTRPDGRICFTVLEDLSLSGYMTAGENIAYGYTSPEAVVEGWMNSEGHRANILNPSFTKIAVGFENNYWVQIFIG